MTSFQSCFFKNGISDVHFSLFHPFQICLLHSSDKLLSHLASKSLVSLVHFQLTEEVGELQVPLRPQVAACIER